MRAQPFGDRYQLRLESGERVAEVLGDFLRREGIGYAALTGLGAFRWVRIAYWNAQTREYEAHDLDEQVEVVSLVGNATLRDGEPALHLHLSLGRRDLSVIGGHFNDAIVHPTLEVWLQREHSVIRRTVEPDTGLALMQIPPDGHPAGE